MAADYSDRNPVPGALYADHFTTVCARFDRALEQAGASHAVIFSGSPKIALRPRFAAETFSPKCLGVL